MHQLAGGGGLLPNDAGSWEVTNSDICVVIAGLTDRLLALVLGLSPLHCAGAGKGEEEEEKGRKEWGERKDKEGGENGELPVVDGADSRPESLCPLRPPGNSLWTCGCWDERFSQSCQHPLKVQSMPGPVSNRGQATFGKLDLSQQEPFSKKP